MRANPLQRSATDPVYFYGLLSDLEALVESRWSDEYDNTCTVAADEAADNLHYEAQGK